MATLLDKYEEDNPVPVAKVYRGKRLDFDLEKKQRGNCGVTVNDEPLRNLAGRMWEWGQGYVGSMGDNLAESILSDFFNGGDVERKRVIAFKRKFVSTFQFTEWSLPEHVIDAWLEGIEREEAKCEKQLEKSEK